MKKLTQSMDLFGKAKGKPTEAQSQLKEAKGKLTKEKKQLAGSKKELAEAQSELEGAKGEVGEPKARLAKAKRNLGRGQGQPRPFISEPPKAMSQRTRPACPSGRMSVARGVPSVRTAADMFPPCASSIERARFNVAASISPR
jgi:hypothetical protein